MSVEITRIKGIPIRLHFTLIITFFLISWTVAVRFTPYVYPGMTSLEYWLVGILGAVLLLLSVLVHELAHCVVAVRYGLHVSEIILFIFGGVSNIEDIDIIGQKSTGARNISKEFQKEFKIAVAGPLTSFAIAVLLLSSLFVLQTTTQSEFTLLRIAKSVLFYGTIVNILVGLFNLIPAFPLDGGRILRAAILKWKKDYVKATRITSKIGIMISYILMGLGFLTIFLGDFFGGTWILLIGWFLNSGANSYLSQYELSYALAGISLSEIMNTKIISLNEDLTVNQSILEYFNKFLKDSFPIVDEANRLLGVVTFNDAVSIPENKRDHVILREMMIPVTKLIIMSENEKADEALMKMTRNRLKRIFVCNDGGRLIGIVSKTDIMNIVVERKEYLKTVKKIKKNNDKSDLVK